MDMGMLLPNHQPALWETGLDVCADEKEDEKIFMKNSVIHILSQIFSLLSSFWELF